MYASVTLILIVVMAVCTWQGLQNPTVMAKYMMDTEAIRLRREWYRMITGAFLHGDWMHFAANALTLYFFGPSLERGPQGGNILLLVFFASVVGGHALLFWLRRGQAARAIGASGGTLGLLYIAVFLLPGQWLLFPPMPLWAYAIGFLLLTIYGLRRSQGMICHEAHLGGALVGILLAALLFPTLTFTQPLLFAVLLLLVGGFLLLEWLNPAHIPGFLRLKWQGWKGKRDSRHSQKRDATLDQLLDKVSREGINSLTDRERAQLQEASRRRRNAR